MLHPFYICIIVFCIFLIVASICLTILRITRSQEQTQKITPTLQEVYEESRIEDNIKVDTISKPFSIQSYFKKMPLYPAFAFDNATLSALKFQGSALVGFRFTLTTFLQISTFQYIAQYSLINKRHACAIYDFNSHLELSDPLDNIIDSDIDPTDENGFVTHTLKKPISLESFHEYVFVIVVNENDWSGNVNMMQPFQALSIKSSIFDFNTSVLAFPTNNNNVLTNLRHFGSFQMQYDYMSLNSIFDVSLITGGYARLPPSYIRGLTFQIDNHQHIDVARGFASSQYSDANIILPLAVRLNSLNIGVNGLDQGTLASNTWYSLYIIGSATFGLPTGTLLSRGCKEPFTMPQGYDVFRRLGSVHTEPNNTSLCLLSQEGNGATRTSYLQDNASNRRVYFGRVPEEYQSFVLNCIPATATRVVLSVTGRAVQLNLPTDMFIRFRRRYDTNEGAWNVGIPNMNNFYAQIEITLGSFPTPHELEVIGMAPTDRGEIPTGYQLSLDVQAYYEVL